MDFDAVYYEPASLSFELGKQLKEQFYDLPWIPIENRNCSRGNARKREFRI